MSKRWTFKRAARLGYLAGRGLSIESIMADEQLAAYSEFAVRKKAANWRVPMGKGGPFTLLVSAEERIRLDDEAARRSINARDLVTAVVRAVLRDGLIDAVLDADGHVLQPAEERR